MKQRRPRRNKRYETFLSVTPGDVESAGFDISQITDDQMRHVARCCANEAVMSAWWMGLRQAAQELGLPKHEEDEGEED